MLAAQFNGDSRLVVGDVPTPSCPEDGLLVRVHTCAICGVSNLSDPKMTFRYCSKCAGAPCYCAEHIHAHQHVSEENGRTAAL